MAEGASYEDALDEAQRLGYAEADPTEDVSGADAAAKVAILATVAFGTRVVFDDVDYAGIDALSPAQVDAARRLELVPRLIGSATLVDDRVDVRVRPSLVDRRHPLASVEGAFNAVMLQGDAIREITLEGPGAGGNETASAVIADLVSIVGTSATGFLQDDAVWRDLERLPPGALRSPFAVQLDVDDRPGVLAEVTRLLAEHELSVARLIQDPTPDGATLHVVLHEAPEGDVLAALEEIAALPESRGRPSALPVVSDRGVAGMGWA
jgi:homoserine dehydrogenase